MRFIRDIISEKAGLAGHQESETDFAVEGLQDKLVQPDVADEFDADLAADMDHADVDLVHKVASGGQSLSGTTEYAFAGEAPTNIEADYKDDAPDLPEADYADSVAIGSELDSDAEYLNDPLLAGSLDDVDEGDTDDASELFGDLWPETTEDADEIDFDLADDIQQQIAQPAQVARPTTRAVLSEIPPAQPAPAPSPAAAPKAEEPESSAFQRMLRRDTQVSSDMPPRQARPVSNPQAEMLDELPAQTPVEMPKSIKVPAPASGRAGRHMGRVKTRLLGFNTAQDSAPDPFENQPSAEPAAASLYPVGWMVVIDGPGRGNAFTLFDGVSQIGRGEGQAIRLDFGDNSISRSNHAAIAYDGEQQRFFVGHGGKANLVRLNGNPVLSTEQLASGAEIRIGETTLRFVALCGDEFEWSAGQDDDFENAQFG